MGNPPGVKSHLFLYQLQDSSYVAGVGEVRACCRLGTPCSVLAYRTSVSQLEGRHVMNVKISWLFSLFVASFFAVPAFAQCKNQQDRACWSLQYILYAAQTDFLEFRGSTPLKPGDRKLTLPNPDLSVGAIHVPCRTDFWLSSEVAMYSCSGELPAQEAEEWYAKTMADLHELQYLWQFKTDSPGADHYVDAGPQGCEPPQLETASYGAFHAEETYIASGPYLGQCPLHLQTVRQPDGTARISFWLNSSVNLARNPKPASQSLELSVSAKPPAAQPHSDSASVPTPLSQTAPATMSSSATSAVPTPAVANPASATSAAATPVPAATELRAEPAPENSVAPSAKRYGDCDDLCQGLKKVLENRTSSFRQLAASSGSSLPSKTPSLGAPVTLAGAESCSIHAEPPARARSSASNEFFPGANFAPVSTKGTKSPASRATARPTKYVCYWPQDSEAAAETEFRDLAGLLQMLIPSSWSAQQKSEADELSGAPVTIWSARDSKNRAAIRMYLSGRSVGLHISSSD
jgi:hypothetical protein